MSGGQGERCLPERCLPEPCLPCPCCIRRAEHGQSTVRRRILAVLAAAGLAALAGLCLYAGPDPVGPSPAGSHFPGSPACRNRTAAPGDSCPVFAPSPGSA